MTIINAMGVRACHTTMTFVLFLFVNRSCNEPQNTALISCVTPHIIHQYLSPNDNRYHGAAKAKWGSMAAERGWGKDDSVESSLALVSILSSFDPEAIRKCFAENLFLERTSIKPDRCMGLITNCLTRKIRKSEYFQRVVSAYQAFMGSSMRESTSSQLPPPPHLTDSLDGRYWKKN